MPQCLKKFLLGVVAHDLNCSHQYLRSKARERVRPHLGKKKQKNKEKEFLMRKTSFLIVNFTPCSRRETKFSVGQGEQQFGAETTRDT